MDGEMDRDVTIETDVRTKIVQSQVPSNMVTQKTILPILTSRQKKLHPFFYTLTFFYYMSY